MIGNVDKDPILEEIGEGYLEAEIEIYDIVKLYDVFGDENALKRLIYVIFFFFYWAGGVNFNFLNFF